MTEVSNFQAVKTSFTFSRSVISSFAVLACLVLGSGCIIVVLSSRVRTEIISSGLVWWFWSVLCISAVKKYVLRFCPPLLLRDSNWTDLFRCSGLRSLESYRCPYPWRESSRLSFWLREGMYTFRVSRVSFPYLFLVLPRESFWLLLSIELFFSRSLLREFSRDPRFRLCGKLSACILSDRMNSSKRQCCLLGTDSSYDSHQRNRRWLFRCGFVPLFPGTPAVRVLLSKRSPVSIFLILFSELNCFSVLWN